MSSEEYQITFCSFYRKGFVENLNLEIRIRGKDSILDEYDPIILNLELRGPEKILGINPNMIARVYPPVNSNDEEPNYFAYIDFIDPDFPWRFTPPGIFTEDNINNNRIDSWLSLVILSSDEIKQMEINEITVIERKDGKEILNINLDLLPPPTLTWSAAHVQLTGFSGSSDIIDTWIQENPEKAFSRLVCFKRLKPETSYHAFLVPNFKKALIPHKLSTLDVETMGDAKAWNDETTPLSLPIYYKWSFITAEKGDFEELVKKLNPWVPNPDEIGTTLIDSSVQKKDELLQKHHFKREGALGVIGLVDDVQETTPHPLKDMLITHMNESLQSKNTTVDLSDIILEHPLHDEEDEDPLVTFPVYGRYFRQTEEILEDESTWSGDRSPWIHKVNLLLKNRVVSGFGTKIVQIHQDKYAEECWRQVGDVRLANERLRLSQASFRLNERLFKKHINTKGDNAKISREHFAFLSTPFQSLFSVRSDNEEISSKRALEKTGVSKGVFTPSFRKIGYKYIGLNTLYDKDQLWEPIKRAEILEKEYFRYLKVKKTCCLFGLIFLILFFICFCLLCIFCSETISILETQAGILEKGYFRYLKVKETCCLFWLIFLILSFICFCLFCIFVFFNIPSEKSISSIVDMLKKKKYLKERERKPKVKPDEFKTVVKENLDINLSLFDDSFSGYEILERKPEIIPVSPIDPSFYRKFEPENLKETVKTKLSRIIIFNNAREIPENFESIMVSPKIDEPMYKPLSKLSLDYIIPGIGKIQNNVTFLLEENRKFIESNMIADNDEMERELVWREYPTDQRGTIFSYFWDSTALEVDEDGQFILDEDGRPIKPTDIDKIHTWIGELGKNKTRNSAGQPVNSRIQSNIVLIIKGDVVRRYPDMVVYAFRVDDKLTKATVDDLDFENVINPIFRAQLGTDILCMGFPITQEQLNSDYYFVLQEQQDLPVFGADLCWDDINVEENQYLREFPAYIFGPESGVTSSSIANKTYQLPVRIFMHASLMFDEEFIRD